MGIRGVVPTHPPVHPPSRHLRSLTVRTRSHGAWAPGGRRGQGRRDPATGVPKRDVEVEVSSRHNLPTQMGSGGMGESTSSRPDCGGSFRVEECLPPGGDTGGPWETRGRGVRVASPVVFLTTPTPKLLGQGVVEETGRTWRRGPGRRRRGGPDTGECPPNICMGPGSTGRSRSRERRATVE